MEKIRDGGSCVVDLDMVDHNMRVVEARDFPEYSEQSDAPGVSKWAIEFKKYLIYNICIGRNSDLGKGINFYPTKEAWQNRVKACLKDLISVRGKPWNARFTIINEPTKYLTLQQYANLVNWAYEIIHPSGFKMGMGNSEFVTAMLLGGWYEYLIVNCNFDIIDLHLQGSCDTEEHTRAWMQIAGGWSKQCGKPLDITEAFYGKDIATSKGYNHLLMLKRYAQLYDCDNFPMVFIRNNFNSWEKLSFIYKGVDRSNGNWTKYQTVMATDAPVPNIIEMEEDMKLDSLYYKDRPEEKYIRDPEKRGIKFLRACFKLSDSNVFDAALDSEIRLYQASKGFIIDGKVGPETFGGLILEADYQKYYNWVQHDWATYS